MATIGSMEESVQATLKSTEAHQDYLSLNAQLEDWGTDAKGNKYVQYDKDREATRQFFLNEVNPNTMFFYTLREKLDFLIDNKYYEKEFLEKYDYADVKALFQYVYSFKHRFTTFVGALKFHNSYALRTFDGKRVLENFSDRVAITALYLADGDIDYARKLGYEMITGNFQTATPTFLNSGKASRGELVSCFLLNCDDDLNSIMRVVNSAAQLSKRGGGVAINLTNVRASGDPIKNIEDQASGVVPIMKILEDTFSYANQLGARQGAGAVYLNAHHMDIMTFLDTKRENADEKIRIKTLSLGVVIPDITFELARREGERMYLFSPYDLEKVYGKQMAWLNISDIYYEAVENPNIRKTSIDPREFLATIAEIQMESGYPYILFEDAANRALQTDGKIVMSNLCVEILQPQTPSILNDDQTYTQIGKDISCNLGSLNMAKVLEGDNFEQTIETAVRALTQVSNFTDMVSVPTVREGNRQSHSIGLGVMNLHGMFAKNRIHFGSEESLDLTNVFFHALLFHAIKASNKIAIEQGTAFGGFETSKYATGEFFQKFINEEQRFTPRTRKVKQIVEANKFPVPTPEDWTKLAKSVKKHGIYSSHLLCVPPTGSISYINHSTPSTLPATSTLVEKRTEGKLGSVYVPNPHAEGNEEYYSGLDMFQIDPKHIIDVNSVVQFYVDQSISLTLGYDSDATTRDVTRNVLYAYSKGKKVTAPVSKAVLEEQLAATAAAKNFSPEKIEAERERLTRQNMLRKYPSAEIKTLYYVRVKNLSLEGTNDMECVSCAL